MKLRIGRIERIGRTEVCLYSNEIFTIQYFKYKSKPFVNL